MGAARASLGGGRMHKLWPIQTKSVIQLKRNEPFIYEKIQRSLNRI